MAQKERIIGAIFKAIDEVNNKLPKESRIRKSMTSEWLGPNSVLDSMGFVFLIVAIEKCIKDEFGIKIKIADAKTAYSENSPLKSAGVLVDYLTAIV